MPNLRERLEANLSERGIYSLRKLFVAMLLILLFWGAWAIVLRLVD